MRIGHGFDVHKFGGEGPLILAGIQVPYSQGLIAHSDGDVILHAVSDALLGAAALGDIGKHFPDTDAQFKNADSGELLKHVVDLVARRGWRPNNLDVTVVAQAPRLASFIPDMCQRIADLTGLPVDAVNVKATTTEQLGYIGRKEGIACHAVALLQELISD